MKNNSSTIRSLRLENLKAVTGFDEALNLNDYNGMDHYERQMHLTENALDALFTMKGDEDTVVL